MFVAVVVVVVYIWLLWASCLELAVGGGLVLRLLLFVCGVEMVFWWKLLRLLIVFWWCFGVVLLDSWNLQYVWCALCVALFALCGGGLHLGLGLALFCCAGFRCGFVLGFTVCCGSICLFRFWFVVRLRLVCGLWFELLSGSLDCVAFLEVGVICS